MMLVDDAYMQAWEALPECEGCRRKMRPFAVQGDRWPGTVARGTKRHCSRCKARLDQGLSLQPTAGYNFKTAEKLAAEVKSLYERGMTPLQDSEIEDLSDFINGKSPRVWARGWTEEQHAAAWTLASAAYRSYRAVEPSLPEHGARVVWDQTVEDFREVLAQLGLFDETTAPPPGPLRQSFVI